MHARPGQRAETRPGWSKRVADRVASMMVVPGLAPGMAWLGLLVACGLGGLQGFPGPQQSTNTAPMPGRAVLEALRMALARTGDVFAGALVALIASEYLVPTRLYLATSTVTGGLITAIGVYIFIQSRREAGDAFARDPTMLAVVLVGIAFHRIAYGLAIVLSCGMGLASGRVAAALLTVQLRRTLSHHTAGISRMAATTSALVITAAGVLILVAAVPSIAER